MTKEKAWQIIKQYLVLTLAALIYAMGVSFFLDVHGIAPGGITGIAIVVKHFTNLDTGMLILVMNLPLFVIGMVKFGYQFLISSLFSTITSSLFITLINRIIVDLPHITDDILLSAVIGGILFGLGIGLTFRVGSSTGGSDIVIKIFRQKFKQFSTGIISNTIDITIIILVAVIYQEIEIALYSAVAAGVCAYVINLVLYGSDTARMVYIISDVHEPIAKRLLNDLDLGVTYVFGEGAYSGTRKKIIMCVLKSRAYPKMKQIVREEDPNAFLICSSANETYGEGFKENSNIEL